VSPGGASAKLLALAAIGLLGCAAVQVDEREALLSSDARLLLEKYRQFMTRRQVDTFLAYTDEAHRAQYVASLRVEERLAAYPKPVADAIWARDVVVGMDRPAVLLSWGTPLEREFGTADGNDLETWFYEREHRKFSVRITNGYVTDVVDTGFAK
jgi:hypothetical protein